MERNERDKCSTPKIFRQKCVFALSVHICSKKCETLHTIIFKIFEQILSFF